MTTYLARKPLTIRGRRYDRHEPVDLSGLPDRLRDRLVDQRRVLPEKQVEHLRGEVGPIRELGGGWCELPDGSKVRGRGEAEAKLSAMEQEA